MSKRNDTIVEFTAFEDFISFERKGKNKVKRVENNKIKVTIEVVLTRVNNWLDVKKNYYNRKNKFYYEEEVKN